MIRAVLGGSFDPVHTGHSAMVRHALSNHLAERIHVVPAWLSPHKDICSASPQQRLAMVQLAFAGWEGVLVDDREVLRGQISFSVDTLRELAGEYPGDSLRLVIGSDNLAGFSTWREWEAIQELVEIVVYPRDGMVPTADDIAAFGLQAERVIPVPDFEYLVSSSIVREILAEGRVPADLLPVGVAEFIISHQIYTS